MLITSIYMPVLVDFLFRNVTTNYIMPTFLCLQDYYMIKKTRIFFVKDEGKKASHKVIFFLLMQVVLFLIFKAFESIEMCLNVMR